MDKDLPNIIRRHVEGVQLLLSLIADSKSRRLDNSILRAVRNAAAEAPRVVQLVTELVNELAERQDKHEFKIESLIFHERGIEPKVCCATHQNCDGVKKLRSVHWKKLCLPLLEGKFLDKRDLPVDRLGLCWFFEGVSPSSQISDWEPQLASANKLVDLLRSSIRAEPLAEDFRSYSDYLSKLYKVRAELRSHPHLLDTHKEFFDSVFMGTSRFPKGSALIVYAAARHHQCFENGECLLPPDEKEELLVTRFLRPLRDAALDGLAHGLILAAKPESRNAGYEALLKYLTENVDSDFGLSISMEPLLNSTVDGLIRTCPKLIGVKQDPWATGDKGRLAREIKAICERAEGLEALWVHLSRALPRIEQAEPLDAALQGCLESWGHWVNNGGGAPPDVGGSGSQRIATVTNEIISSKHRRPVQLVSTFISSMCAAINELVELWQEHGELAYRAKLDLLWKSSLAEESLNGGGSDGEPRRKPGYRSDDDVDGVHGDPSDD